MDRLKPKKHLGQHFLNDAQVTRRLVDTLQAGAEASVVEVGPGEGMLTRHLVSRYPDFVAVEVDPEAVFFLQKNLHPRPRVVHCSVLQWQPADELSHPAHFIGNLPYNISSPFFFMLLENRAWVREGVFMIQKEVADRICAAPGSKAYGVLSILLGTYFELSYAFSVPPGAFRPPPKVMSAVIRLVAREAAPEVDYQALRKVVKAAFGQRRKTLRNALKGMNIDLTQLPQDWGGQRAEQLPMEAFWTLSRLCT
jgi:16S rRNA (adenine1518-N6/adenine1519-N6)-dimethyltransferase